MTAPPPLEPPAVPVLDYGPPPRSHLGLRLWFAFGVVLLAAGVGLAVYGIMMGMRFRDDEAAPAGIGVGLIFANYLSGALRNPSAADGQFARLIFGFAVTEALGIFSLLVALLLLFVV